VVLVVAALVDRRPLGFQKGFPEQPTQVAEVVEYLGLRMDRLPALAALASSSSVTHSVWHKDFK
jgi:hypothetical protein